MVLWLHADVTMLRRLVYFYEQLFTCPSPVVCCILHFLSFTMEYPIPRFCMLLACPLSMCLILLQLLHLRHQ